MTVRSAWHLNPGQTRQDTRLSPVGAYTPLDAMQTRAGVIPGGTGMLLTGSGMSGTVATGRAIVQGTAAQGAYPVAITAAEAITVANGHASLPRIDTVWLVAYDQLYDTSGQTLAAVVYTQGTAAGSPTAPTAPATGTAYLRLWDILVPAGASAGSPINWATALTDQRVYTVAVGGITPNAVVAGAHPGQWRDNNGVLERYTGSVWESALRVQNSGTVQVGDVPLTRSATSTMQVGGNLSVTGIGQTLFARKTTNQNVTNSNAQQDDANLTFSVAANAVYAVDGYLIYGADPTANLKIGFVGPAGATFDWNVTGAAGGASSTISPVILDDQAIGTFGYIMGGITSNATKMTGKLTGLLVTSGTAGTFKYTWAQNNVVANATIMYAGSYMRLTRVG